MSRVGFEDELGLRTGQQSPDKYIAEQHNLNETSQASSIAVQADRLEKTAYVLLERCERILSKVRGPHPQPQRTGDAPSVPGVQSAQYRTLSLLNIVYQKLEELDNTL